MYVRSGCKLSWDCRMSIYVPTNCFPTASFDFSGTTVVALGPMCVQAVPATFSTRCEQESVVEHILFVVSCKRLRLTQNVFCSLLTTNRFWHRSEGHTAKLFNSTIHSEACCWYFWTAAAAIAATTAVAIQQQRQQQPKPYQQQQQQ